MRTTTQNLAELVAFTRALQWSSSSTAARGRPVCVRYTTEYAARIATGAWKAKKHKAVAAEARGAWARLQHVSGSRAWMQHVKPTQRDSAAARGLASEGKQGRHTYEPAVT